MSDLPDEIKSLFREANVEIKDSTKAVLKGKLIMMF